MRQHHYARGSTQRERLTAALDDFNKRGPLEVPIVVGGKKVHDRSEPIKGYNAHTDTNAQNPRSKPP